MHVPKCGGTSIHKALERALPAGSLSAKRRGTFDMRPDFTGWGGLEDDIRAEIALTDDDISEMRAAQVVIGHFTLDSLLGVTQAHSIATVLREPRARLLSHFAFLRVHTPDQRRPRPFMVFEAADGTLDDFLGEPVFAASTDNVVCRMLLHDAGVIPETGFIAPSEIAGIAAAALARLDELGSVSVLEIPDEMWDELSRFFGVALEPQREQVTGVAVSLQRAVAPIRLDRRTFELLELRVAADAIVYERTLARRGMSGPEIRLLSDAAFGDQLIRLGDVSGRSAAHASELQTRLNESQEALQSAAEESGRLEHELSRRSEEVASAERRYQRTKADLQLTKAELEWHRARLAGIEQSRSWRLTAGLRSAKRAFRSGNRRHSDSD